MFSIIRASIGRRIGIVVAGGLAVWVPVKIAKITILGSRIGSEGLMGRLLRGIQAMLLVKVVFRMSSGRGVLKSVGKKSDWYPPRAAGTGYSPVGGQNAPN